MRRAPAALASRKIAPRGAAKPERHAWRHDVWYALGGLLALTVVVCATAAFTMLVAAVLIPR